MIATDISNDTCRHDPSRQHCAECKVRLISVCAALEPDELAELERLAQQLHFPARQTLFMQGDTADCVYSITCGMARLYRLLPDGRRQIVGFAIPGDFLGLAMNDRFGFSADAVEPLNVCRFVRTSYANLVDSKPHLLRRLHEFSTHELTLAQDQMTLLGRRTAEEKIVAFLLSMRERWAKLTKPSVTVRLPMSRQDIADFLGLTIETVSRTITKLGRDRMILVVPDGVRLLNLEALEQIAGN